jgi:DnaJ-class molecular chaperone
VQPGASEQEIRAAYKRLAAQYHPDKVQHLGREFQELAHNKFVAIQKAYDVLMKQCA